MAKYEPKNKREKNLKPLNERSPKERKEIATMGAIASNEAQRKKKELKECLQALLEMEMKGKNGETKSGAEALAAQLFKKALSGDVRAFEVLRDTAGQKPVERVQLAEIEPATIEEVEKIFND